MMLVTEPNKGIAPLRRWIPGQRLDHRHLNEAVTLLQRLSRGAPLCRQIRRKKAHGHGRAAFDWAIVRQVDVTNRILKVQRVKYGDDPIDQEWESGTYRKLVLYGDEIDVLPAPGSTYEMFDVPRAIRPTPEPGVTEKFGWTIYPVKLYGDNTIEWAFKLPPGLAVVDPEDEEVSA